VLFLDRTSGVLTNGFVPGTGAGFATRGYDGVTYVSVANAAGSRHIGHEIGWSRAVSIAASEAREERSEPAMSARAKKQYGASEHRSERSE
jgi:hypothetical protein